MISALARSPHLQVADLVDRLANITRESNLGLIEFTCRMNPNYQPSRVHEYLAAALERVARGETKRLLISYPPRHGKTELASINFPPWVLGTHPHLSIINVSYTAALANRNSRRARNLIRDGRYPFPVRLAGDRSAVQQWITTGGGEYNAAGVGGSITGMGADILIIDDYVKNIVEADSPERRQAVWDWYRDVAYPRLQQGAAIIVIGTRWHEDDLIGRLLKQQDEGGDQWETVILKAIAEIDPKFPDPLHRQPGEALWPERYGIDELLTRRKQLSSRQWRAQYQASPVADEGGTFKRGWWRYWHPPGIALPPVETVLGDGTIIRCPVVERPRTYDEQLQSWDCNFGDAEGENASYVAGLVAGTSQHETYILDRYWNRATFTETEIAIRSMSALYPLSGRKLIEKKANGPAILSRLGSEIPGMIGVEPYGNKLARANAVTAFVESGNVLLPHPMVAPWVTELVDELAAFPASQFSDQVDAMSQLLTAIYLGGGIGGGEVTSTAYVEWGEREIDPWAAPGEPGYVEPNGYHAR